MERSYFAAGEPSTRPWAFSPSTRAQTSSRAAPTSSSGARQGKRPLGETLVAIHRARGAPRHRGDRRRRAPSGWSGDALGDPARRARPRLASRRSRTAPLSSGRPPPVSPGRSAATSRTRRRRSTRAAHCWCFDASVELVSRDGRRTVALDEFFQGPGRTVRERDGARERRRGTAASDRACRERVRAARVPPGDGDRRRRSGCSALPRRDGSDSRREGGADRGRAGLPAGARRGTARSRISRPRWRPSVVRPKRLQRPPGPSTTFGPLRATGRRWWR